MANTNSNNSVSRSSLSLSEHRDIFGSFNESDDPSTRGSHSLDSDRGGGLGQSNNDEGDA